MKTNLATQQSDRLISTFPLGAEMSASRYVRSPITARRAARVLAVLFVVTMIALIFVPWQQSFSASGRVIALDPTLREQIVEAPVSGRIHRVHVVEGQRVQGRELDDDGNVIPGKEGTLLVTIRDPDPQLMKRLHEQKRALEERLTAAQQRVQALTNQIEALNQSRDQALKVAEKKTDMARKRVKAAEQSLESSKAAHVLAIYQHEQQKKLLRDSLTSDLEYQKAVQQLESAKAEKIRNEAALLEAELSVLAYEADYQKVGFDFDASIRSATASLQQGASDVASADASLTELNVRISRQGTQDVYAPCDGTVFRVLAHGAGGGMLVKEGQALMRIVPDVPDEQRVVELVVSGNDAPLIVELWQERLLKTGERPRIPVRLQFEGYPAIQWVGWPSAAVGTFGGILEFVDETDDGKGNFRIIVSRDPDEELTNPWPSGFALRQGLRTNGWVLLHQVPLGWEAWRRLNGFPPVVAGESPGKEDKSKPAILKGFK